MVHANFSTQCSRKPLLICLSWSYVGTLLPPLDYPKATQLTGDGMGLKLKPSDNRAFDSITIAFNGPSLTSSSFITFNWTDPLEQDIQKIKWLIKNHGLIRTSNYLLSFGWWIEPIRHYSPFHLNYDLLGNVLFLLVSKNLYTYSQCKK